MPEFVIFSVSVPLIHIRLLLVFEGYLKMKIPFWGKTFQYVRVLSKYMAGPLLEWTALPESRDAVVKELIKTFLYARH